MIGSNAVQAVTGVLVTLAAIAGVVVLVLKGADVSALLAVVGPVLASLFVGARVDARSNAQDQVLNTISDNTNGKLSARIRTEASGAVEDVLIRHGLIQTPAPAVPQPAPDPGTS